MLQAWPLPGDGGRGRGARGRRRGGDPSEPPAGSLAVSPFSQRCSPLAGKGRAEGGAAGRAPAAATGGGRARLGEHPDPRSVSGQSKAPGCGCSSGCSPAPGTATTHLNTAGGGHLGIFPCLARCRGAPGGGARKGRGRPLRPCRGHRHLGEHRFGLSCGSFFLYYLFIFFIPSPQLFYYT